MTQATSCGRQGEKGFTLVELAIVMIIIGLLIGGILKGQELIANARVTSQVSQVKGIDAAMTTFRDQYNSLPGDIANPNGRLPNCAAAICNVAGNGDTRVQDGTANDPGAASANSEGGRAFIHMAAAGVLGGVNPGAAAYGPDAVPDAQIGAGKLTFGYSNGTITGAVAAAGIGAGHYLTLKSTEVATATANLPLVPKTAANIDRKLDDGNPNTGSVLATGTASATTCANAATAAGIYNENLTTAVCSLAIRIQQ